MEVRFLADSMLGRLAKWLRVMGYDTHYQSFYREDVIEQFSREGRILLSRHKPTVERYSNSLLIRADHVKDQLQEVRHSGALAPQGCKWFSRCLICNVSLIDAEPKDVSENVPEYIFHQNITGIRFCPSCGRYFWPGSHRERMIRQLEEWGFKENMS
jgi:uncharacterized protein with PIN domain